MGTGCQTREIRDKKIVWPATEDTLICNGKFILRVIGNSDVRNVAELWRTSYPEVYGSIHGWMLYPEEYRKKVALKEDWESDSKKKVHAMLVAEEINTGCLVMASMLTKFDLNLHVEASFFTIHPDYRQGKGGFYIWNELLQYYKWLEASGAEYITVFCETWQDITQYIWFKRFGWKVAGIFPGNMTRWCGDTREYRGCTVYFYRLINQGDQYSTKPDEWKLLPEMKRLWDCLEEINKGSDDAGLREE
jgi:hypothetical protein